MTYSGRMLVDLEHRVMDVLSPRAGFSFAVGPTSFHIGQEVLDAFALTLQDLPPTKRLEVLEAFANVLEHLTRSDVP